MNCLANALGFDNKDFNDPAVCADNKEYVVLCKVWVFTNRCVGGNQGWVGRLVTGVGNNVPEYGAMQQPILHDMFKSRLPEKPGDRLRR